MFKRTEATQISDISPALQSVEHNYIIEPNDYLEIEVFTKGGEKLIDPEYELSNNTRNESNLRPKLQYLVQNNGFIKLPMIGPVKLVGLTIKDAEAILSEKYATFYKEPFVNLKYMNKRVVILGALGGHVVPLENENLRITEILALSEGIDNSAKVENIRLLRGDEVFIIDLSTIEGYRHDNMIVKSGDIIYVEPVKRPFTEFVKDNGPVISVLSSVASLIAVLISIK